MQLDIAKTTIFKEAKSVSQSIKIKGITIRNFKSLFDVSFEDISIFTFISTFIIKLIALVYIAKCLKIQLNDNVYVSFSALFLLLAIGINFLPNSIFDIYYYMILQLLSIIIDIYIINKLCIEAVKKDGLCSFVSVFVHLHSFGTSC